MHSRNTFFTPTTSKKEIRLFFVKIRLFEQLEQPVNLQDDYFNIEAREYYK